MADTGTVFLNADYVVIEYIDFIKSPYLILLGQIRNQLRRNKKDFNLREILDTEQIEHLDDASLYEWYLMRKHRNFFIDLVKPELGIAESELDELLEDQLSLSPLFYTMAVPLILVDAIKVIKKQKMCKDVIIYHPHHNDFAKKDFDNLMGSEFTFMTDFNEVMEKAKSNSTYFLSDINNIIKLRDANYLNFTSVTIPIEYRYNKKNLTDFSIDFGLLVRDYCVKISYARACSFEHHNPEV